MLSAISDRLVARTGSSQLMRSRYSAFVMKDADYLIATGTLPASHSTSGTIWKGVR